MKRRIFPALALVFVLGFSVLFSSCASAADSKIGSEEELLEAFTGMREKGAVSFRLKLAKAYASELEKNNYADFPLIALKAGMSDYSLKYSSSGEIVLDNVSWSEPNMAECATEEGFEGTVKELLSAGVPSCQIVVTEQEVFDTLLEKNRVFMYAALGGAEEVSVRHSLGAPYIIYLDDIRYYGAPWRTVAGEAEWLTAVEEMEAEYVTGFWLIPEPSFGRKLLADEELLNRLEGAAPVYLYNYSYSQETIVNVKLSAAYPGVRIVSAVASGDLSGLTKRERETLSAAEELAEACRQKDPLATAQAVHDALCERIVYRDDDSTDEDDNATGALLNGQANCDGYSDAFYLAGTLAGLEVRCQHGESRRLEEGDRFRDVSHMWNLLKIDGTWRVVDVTWDDQEDGPVYTWFNIGADRARRMHMWDEEISMPLLEETLPSGRPAGEYMVRNAGEVSAAALDAVQNGYACFTLVFADGGSIEKDAALDELSQTLNRSFSYSWNEYMQVLTVLAGI